MSCRSFFACMALYLGVSLIASTCLADTINQAAIIDHLSTQQVNSALVTASPAFCRDVDRNITVRGFAHHQGAFGFRGFGVAGGSVDGEIDNYGCLVTISVPESITIDYDQPVIVTEIVLLELFARGNGDTVNETALIQVNDGPVVSLTASSPTVGTYTGPQGSVVTNISPADQTGDGVWKITNPFGSLQVNRLKFYPNPDGESDFSIVSVTDETLRNPRVPPVPQPLPSNILGLLGTLTSTLAALNQLAVPGFGNPPPGPSSAVVLYQESASGQKSAVLIKGFEVGGEVVCGVEEDPPGISRLCDANEQTIFNMIPKMQ